MQVFSRKEAPMGDFPEMIIARSPGESTMSCAAFTTPDVGTSVPFGMMTEEPLASLTNVHSERLIGMPAFCETEISTYSFFGSSEPAPET